MDWMQKERGHLWQGMGITHLERKVQHARLRHMEEPCESKILKKVERQVVTGGEDVLDTHTQRRATHGCLEHICCLTEGTQ